MTKIGKRITGYSVVRPDATPAKPALPSAAPADRRMQITKAPDVSGALRWEKRPRPAGGNPSWTYMVDAPSGAFGITIGHIENGHASPFEVWVNGDRAPRGLPALAKSISMDMRSLDRAWLVRKLEALQKVMGEPFVLPMPDGREVRVNSPVDAFARLIYARCDQLGVFDGASEGTLTAAMLSAKEPKTTAEGTLSWTVDVINHATGDDICMFLKEVQLADGQKRPLSVWLAGDYPKSLDGLCKAISLDLRIADVGWALRKLDQLRDVSEHRGEFRAQVPGSDKTAWYPSTVAYIAALIQYRMHVHGYCDANGRQLGKTTLSVVESTAPAVEHHVAAGPDCSACGGVGTIQMQGGCSVCRSCGSSSCS